MSMLEDRVRRVLRETAEEITPLDVPPLRLGQAAGGGPGGNGRLPHARWAISWPGWLTPLAAAAAVVAVLAASLALTGALSGHRPAHRGLPRYYLALASTGGRAGQPSWRQQAEVRVTATSQTVATLVPPRPDNAFIMVAAAGWVGRYVLAAQRIVIIHRKHHLGIAERDSAIRFYQVRISSSGRVSALHRLAIPELPAGSGLDGLTLTPDGRRLAVASQPPRPGDDPQIRVDTLATGAQRVWTWPGGQPIQDAAGGTGTAVSWAADDRTLAFQRWVDGYFQVRLLDTAAPGSSLAASRVALRLKWDGSGNRFRHGRAVNDVQSFAALLTPDGSKIVAATDTQTQRPLTADLGFTEFSARTGQVIATRDRWRLTGHLPQEIQGVLWSNADGSTLLVVSHWPGATGSQGNFGLQFGVLRGNRYTPLPGAPRPGQLSAWPSW